MEISRREFFKQAVTKRSLAKLSGTLFGGLQGLLALGKEPVSLEEAGMALRTMPDKRSRRLPDNPLLSEEAPSPAGADLSAESPGNVEEAAESVSPPSDDSGGTDRRKEETI